MNHCILVFGMPRSGTTWIGKLFDSHPDTLYRHEPDSVHPLSLPLYPEAETADRYHDELECFVASLPRMRSAKVVGKQPLFPKNYQSAAALRAYRASVVFAKAVGRVKQNFPCLYRPTAAGFRGARLVWKSIESPGRLGICMAALPSARAVYVIRHPCGYVASVLRGEATSRFSEAKPSENDSWRFKLLLAASSSRKHGLTLQDIERLTAEERLAWCWLLIQEKVLADISGCERVLTLRYEDVCVQPLAMTRRMFEFTGLEWQPQSERFVRASTQTAKRATDTEYYSVYKPPLASAERWRTELAPEVVERVLRIVRGSPLCRHYADEIQAPAAPAVEAAT